MILQREDSKGFAEFCGREGFARAWVVVACLSAAGCADGCLTERDRGLAGTKSPQGPVEDSSAPRPPKPKAPPPKIFAKRFVAKVRGAPGGQAQRIGYLRAGAVLRAQAAEPAGREGCPRGWLLLETGGFVCRGRDVIAFEGSRLPERRALQPDRTAKLPYPYASARKPATPMFRRPLTREEWEVWEAGAAQPSESPAKPNGRAGPRAPQRRAGARVVDGGYDASRGAVPESQSSESENPDVGEEESGAAEDLEAEVQGAEESGAAEDLEAEVQGAEEDVDSGVFGVRKRLLLADAGPPSLDSLTGARDTYVMRLMMKGFIVSLDREFEVRGRRYWRTQSNGYIPAQGLVPIDGSDFQGVDLSAEEWSLPVGFVLSGRAFAYEKRSNGRLRREREPAGYHHRFAIASTESVRGRSFYVSTAGRYYPVGQVTRVDAIEPPSGLPNTGKWIAVDLEAQSLVAYEGNRPVYVTLISSGRMRPGDPEHYLTPQGTFYITSKHLTHAMDGDTASDGPYSIEDVPYVMYFQLAYALHSAFWHNLFGRPRSHGCINMAPFDARWVFEWSSPVLPKGWHGVYPTDPEARTGLYIYGVTPK